MLFPGDGIDGIKRFYLDTLIGFGKRGLACQPAIVGVGLGGSKDTCMVLGKQASCLRVVGSRNPDPKIAALEEEFKELGNTIGMGAMGFIGSSMVVDCHIEVGYCHTGGMPMSVHMFCLSSRRACARICADGGDRSAPTRCGSPTTCGARRSNGASRPRRGGGVDHGRPQDRSSQSSGAHRGPARSWKSARSPISPAASSRRAKASTSAPSRTASACRRARTRSASSISTARRRPRSIPTAATPSARSPRRRRSASPSGSTAGSSCPAATSSSARAA